MAQLFTISAGEDFLKTLALGLKARYGTALPEALIVLPTRRACQRLRDVFLELEKNEHGNYAVLLPRIRPLAQADEDELLLSGDEALTDTVLNLPPAITPMRRRLLLTELILKKEEPTLNHAQAFLLAGDLATLLDQMLIEECGFEKLHTLVPEAYAQHWQKTLVFLDIIGQQWPLLLKAEGLIEAVERQRAIMQAIIIRWQNHPPATPIIAAGSTGTQPMTARLLYAIARLPQGAVVLPGLDQHLEEDAWQALDASHPQYGLMRFLKKENIGRDQVKNWHEDVTSRQDRAAFLSDMMRPASYADRWRHSKAVFAGKKPWENLYQIDAANTHQEAAVAALIMRETLEHKGKTAALVTPDRALASRVAAYLARWNIHVDDSAGTPLHKTALGQFFNLMLPLGHEALLPSELMALLKHPYMQCDGNRAATLASARLLEKDFFRTGLRGENSMVWLAALNNEAKSFLEKLLQYAIAFKADTAKPIATWVRLHKKLAEDLSGNTENLWQGPAGEALADLLEALEQSGTSTPLSYDDYQGIFRAILKEKTVRVAYGQHPRLAILGLLEARLLHFDTIVLAGLNEGIWPQSTPDDPWLSRAMRIALGLPAPEQPISLMAHDFVQLAAQKNVFLLRAERQGETPTIASRWLLRLGAFLKMLREEKALEPAQPWRDWARYIDQPAVFMPMDHAPAVRVKRTQMPARLSASDMGLWVADPYAFYAKKILGLHPLDPLDAELGPRERGNVIHKALERVLALYPGHWPDEAAATLFTLIEDGLRSTGVGAAMLTLMRPRLQVMAARFHDYEKNRREKISATYTECKGAMIASGLEINARADRIDVLYDGTCAILDYKTGAMPKPAELELGLKPQLLIEALIAAKGGFADIKNRAIAEVGFLRIKEDNSSIAAKPLIFAPDSLAMHADAFENFIAAFFEEGALFHAAPRPQLLAPSRDYARLARVSEWSKGALMQEGA